MKYEFKVGDYVETIDGKVGYISSICNCDQCKKRGFYEPEVIYNNDTDYITYYEKQNGFKGYKRIGKYEFLKEEHNKIENIPYEEDNDRTLTYEVIHDGTDGFNECFVNRIEVPKIPKEKKIMKNKIFMILSLVCIVIFVISTGYLMIQTFVQIDMTKTRFAITFWKEELVAAMSMILGINFLKMRYE